MRWRGHLGRHKFCGGSFFFVDFGIGIVHHCIFMSTRSLRLASTPSWVHRVKKFRVRQRTEAAHGRRQEPRCWENFKPTATLCRVFTLSASDTDLCLAWFVAVFHIASLLNTRTACPSISPLTLSLDFEYST